MWFPIVLASLLCVVAFLLVRHLLARAKFLSDDNLAELKTILITILSYEYGEVGRSATVVALAYSLGFHQVRVDHNLLRLALDRLIEAESPIYKHKERRNNGDVIVYYTLFGDF